MSNQRLRELVRPVVEAMRPPSEMFTARNTASVVAEDGTVRRDAIAATIPAYAVTFYAPGDFNPGASIAEEIVVPQAGKLVRMDALLKTASSSGSVVVHVTVNGVSVKSLTLGVAVASLSAGINADVAQGDVLRLNSTATGNALDLTVTVAIIPNIK